MRAFTISFKKRINRAYWKAEARLTFGFDIWPGPFKEMDLHAVLPGYGAVIGEKALRVSRLIPAAADCCARNVPWRPEKPCTSQWGLCFLGAAMTSSLKAMATLSVQR